MALARGKLTNNKITEEAFPWFYDDEDKKEFTKEYTERCTKFINGEYDDDWDNEDIILGASELKFSQMLQKIADGPYFEIMTGYEDTFCHHPDEPESLKKDDWLDYAIYSETSFSGEVKYYIRVSRIEDHCGRVKGHEDYNSCGKGRNCCTLISLNEFRI